MAWFGRTKREDEGQEGIKRASASLMVALGLLLFLGNGVELFAQPAPQSTAAESTVAEAGQENVVCQIEMGKFLEVENKRYREFIEGHFQNKSSTESLLDTALARYAQHRDILYREYFKYFPHQGALQITEATEPGACRKMVEDSLVEARRALISKARATSSVKRTTALLQKYQEINGKLRGLNLTFLRMKAYLDAFSDKLPCYLQDMCNKK